MNQDYTGLKEARRFRMKIHADGYAAREIHGVGEGLFDVMLSHLEDDGSIVFTDIGGQDTPEFDPAKGHGAILRLRPDGTIDPIVAHADIGQFVPMNVHLAPAHFGGWGGHLFLPAQTAPGRPGANLPHCILRIAPGARRPELVQVLPPAGTINGGIAGAVMGGGFAPSGSPFGASYFLMSLKNCTIYRLDASGKVEPFINFDRPEGPIMPYQLQFAPAWWGELAGELIMFAAVNASFNTGRPDASSFANFIVRPDRSIERIDKVPAPLNGVQAPPEFGPFAGHVFFPHEGQIDLAVEEGCDEYAGDALPYGGRILRQDPQGQVHVFADDFWGSFTTLVFDGPRLVLGLTGKSYSTGEYHKPDGAIYEISWSAPTVRPR